MTNLRGEIEKILTELAFNRLEDWRKTPIQKSINQAAHEILQAFNEMLPKEKEQFSSFIEGRTLQETGIYNFNSCLAQIRKRIGGTGGI